VEQEQFDQAFDEACEKAVDDFAKDFPRGGSMTLGPLLEPIALTIHRSIIAARQTELADRGNVLEREWNELDAYRQAEVANTILVTSKLDECQLILAKGMFRHAEKLQLTSTEKQAHANAATASFGTLDSMDNLVREAILGSRCSLFRR